MQILLGVKVSNDHLSHNCSKKSINGAELVGKVGSLYVF